MIKLGYISFHFNVKLPKQGDQHYEVILYVLDLIWNVTKKDSTVIYVSRENPEPSITAAQSVLESCLIYYGNT